MTIQVDGQATQIRLNLHNALDHLRLLGIYGPIWIDALCINQADVAERNSQASQMSRIYENAEEVIVWLGKEETYSVSAIKSMQKLTFTMKDALAFSLSTSSPTSPWERDLVDCQLLGNELMEIIEFYVNYRWFSRIWTVQELLLARHLRFVCGTIIELLHTIWRGGGMLQFLGLTHSTKALQWAADFSRAISAEYARQRLNEPPPYIG